MPGISPRGTMSLQGRLKLAHLFEMPEAELAKLARKLEEHAKGMLVPGTMFEEFGFNYIGPIDGHDLDVLEETLNDLKRFEEPEEIASFVTYLASPLASAVTGAALRVDGGVVKSAF